jgi:hypothetical protein
VDWIDMAQDGDQWRALVNTVLKLRVPWNAGEFLRACTIHSSSRRAQLHKLVSKYTYDGFILDLPVDWLESKEFFHDRWWRCSRILIFGLTGTNNVTFWRRKLTCISYMLQNLCLNFSYMSLNKVKKMLFLNITR